MFYIQKMPGCVTILCEKQMFFLQIIASFQHRLNEFNSSKKIWNINLITNFTLALCYVFYYSTWKICTHHYLFLVPAQIAKGYKKFNCSKVCPDEFPADTLQTLSSLVTDNYIPYTIIQISFFIHKYQWWKGRRHIIYWVRSIYMYYVYIMQ